MVEVFLARNGIDSKVLVDGHEVGHVARIEIVQDVGHMPDVKVTLLHAKVIAQTDKKHTWGVAEKAVAQARREY